MVCIFQGVSKEAISGFMSPTSGVFMMCGLVPVGCGSSVGRTPTRGYSFSKRIDFHPRSYLLMIKNHAEHKKAFMLTGGLCPFGCHPVRLLYPGIGIGPQTVYETKPIRWAWAITIALLIKQKRGARGDTKSSWTPNINTNMPRLSCASCIFRVFVGAIDVRLCKLSKYFNQL